MKLKDAEAELNRWGNVRIRIDEIQACVGDYFSLSRAELIGNRRIRRIARPRQIAMYLARKLTGQSLIAVGRRFGDVDHTTVIHATRKITALMGVDALFRASVESLEATIIGQNLAQAAHKASQTAWAEFESHSAGEMTAPT